MEARGAGTKREGRALVVVAPRFMCLSRFGGDSLEVKLQVMTRRGAPASLTNLDAIANSPLASPPLGRGLRSAAPMAASYLESFFRLRGYDAVAVVDWDDGEALRRALRADPLAVLFSTTFVTDADVLGRCLAELRREVGGTPILVGGPFIHKQARLLRRGGDGRRAAALREFGVDASAGLLFRDGRDPALDGCVFVAAPCGERTAAEVLSRLERGMGGADDLADVPNLVFKGRAGDWRCTERAPEPIDLEADFTRWDLVDAMPAVIPIRTALGCAGRCRFCDFRSLHPRLLLRRVDSVVAEMRSAAARGGAFFSFVDDEILVSGARARELTSAIVGAGIDAVWGGFFAADRVDEDVAGRLWESGFRFGLTGFESGSPAQLERMGKRLDLAAARRGVEALVDRGARVELTFIVGFPGEDRATLDATAALIDGLPPGRKGYAFFELFPFELFAGTEADTPRFRRRFGLRGRGTRWSHDTASSEEVISTHAPYVFGKVGRTPYYHGADDAPPWWAPGRRDEAFARRAALARGFLGGLGEREIQARFEDLFRLVAEPRQGGAVPPWAQVLALRSAQPGGRVDG